MAVCGPVADAGIGGPGMRPKAPTGFLGDEGQPMTVERLKIRCYRCNQLLAVSPNKAGTVVACPKCKADLLIPRLDSQATGDEAEDSGLAASLSQPRKGSASATAHRRRHRENPPPTWMRSRP